MAELTLSAYDDFDIVRGENNGEGLFSPFTFLCFALILFFGGLVTLYSASFDKAVRYGLPHYYFLMQQGIGALAGLGVGLLLIVIPRTIWGKMFHILIPGSIALMVLSILGYGPVLSLGLGNVLGLLSSIAILFLMNDAFPVIYRSERRGFPLIGCFLSCSILMILSALSVGMGWFVLQFFLVMFLLNTNDVKLSTISLFAIVGIVTGIFLFAFFPQVFSSVVSSSFRVSDPDLYSRNMYLAQSAVSDGGMFGVGLGQGVYKLGLLDAPEGELIFATLAEEIGSFSFVLILLPVLMIEIVAVRTINRARRREDMFAASTVTGLSIILLFGMLLNMLHTLGLNSFSGIEMPLFSYNPYEEGLYVAFLCLLYKYIHLMGRRGADEK